MSYKLGEIYCIDTSANKKQYALVIRKAKDVEATYVLAKLTKAKQYEYDSCICIGDPYLKGRTKKEKVRDNERKLKIASTPFFIVDSLSYGNPVGYLNRENLIKLLPVLNDKKAYKKEIERLKKIKDDLHNRLSVLKNMKEINKINNIDYSDIEKEMQDISFQLGYEIIDYGPRKKQFREAPSKYIKVYLGGRGG